MRVSLFLPPWGDNATVEHVRRVAEAVDASALATLWVGDHVIFPRTIESNYLYNDTQESPFHAEQPHFEALALLGYLAGRLERAGLGISVLIVPIRNPLLTGKFLANLQTLAAGGIRVGVGVGWLKEEFAALDADFAARGAVTDEYVDIFRHLWSGRIDGFRGQHYRFEPVGLRPIPFPQIPVLVGGNSDVAIRRAVRTGDGWHPLRIEPEMARVRIAHLHERLREADRDPASFDVVLRAPLLELERLLAGPGPNGDDVEAFHARVRDYASAGVDEYVLEFPFPQVGPPLQSAWLAWIVEQVDTLPVHAPEEV